MSFISSRAKAFKQRFSHRQRSFSDSWMDQTSLDYTHIDDPAGVPAFETGSIQSLLDENVEWGPTIVVQRSKSLESVSTYHRPSITTIYSAAAPLQCTQSSVSIAVTLNSRRPSTIMQKVPLPKPKEQLKLPSCEFIPQFFSTPLLQSPATGDGDTELLMSGTADVNSSCEEVQTSARSTFRELKPKPTRMHQPTMTPILSRSRPSVPKSIHSTSCCQISDSQIPKIPGPPPTPKKLRPVSACSLDPGAFEPPSLLDFASDPLENVENTKPLIDMSSPPQRRKSRPFSCASFDPLLSFDVPVQVQQTSSIPNLTNETHAHPPKIPNIKAPPLSPKTSKPSSTRSLNPFSRPSDGVDSSTQSTSIPNLNQKTENVFKPTDSSTSSPFLVPVEKGPLQQSVLTEALSDQFCGNAEKPLYRKKMSISTLNLTLPLDPRKPPVPFDPEQWRQYVQQTFSSSIQETGECILKSDRMSQKSFVSNEKIKEKVPQVLKSQKYTKLKHQTSMDETRHYKVDQSTNTTTNNRLQEKRKIFFLRKQNNSAPEPIDEDDYDLPKVATAAAHEKETHSVNLCIGRCRARGSDSSILLPTISEYSQVFCIPPYEFHPLVSVPVHKPQPAVQKYLFN
ncbi:hypothetical protein RUM43_013697 [Polyplax serrata]|uniref:Uncharacterized protein n=1 Tax=Polyplax serrata TaxID=468196 RepID=A0AAN8P0W8_POLSC